MINIFVTNLGKYNEGYLIGEWLELPCSVAEIESCYERIGINEEYEEVFITDYECDIDGITVDEYSNIEKLNELAEELARLDDYELEIISAMISEGYSFDDALENKDNCRVYYGCTDMTDVAEQYCDECGILDQLPDHLRCYFDFEAFGRDMFYEGCFVFTDNDNCVEIF